MNNVKTTEPDALALHQAPRIEAWRTPDWQRLWLASHVEQRPWQSLALVPAAAGATPELMLKIAITLAHTGMTHLRTPIHVADGTRVSLADLQQFEQEVQYYRDRQEMVIIALSALSESVTTLSLAQAADRALLVVLLRKMAFGEGKKTVERIGASRFVGSAVFRDPKA